MSQKDEDFMIVVKLKVNRAITAEHWKQMAIGAEDQYGNPFRLIKLRWNNSKLHRMTDYVKTKGFEDAVIHKNRATGDIAISYRQNGSIMWQRPVGGVGPFIGEVAFTPKNMNRLASMFGDRLFTIMEPDINRMVSEMYDKLRAGMRPDVREFNDDRIAAMHVSRLDTDLKSPSEIPLEVEKTTVMEQNRLNQIRQMEQDKREEGLRMKEEALTDNLIDKIGGGAAPITYSKEYLASVKSIADLRKIAREIKCEVLNTDTKDALMQKIADKQSGNEKAVKEQIDQIHAGKSLED